MKYFILLWLLFDCCISKTFCEEDKSVVSTKSGPGGVTVQVYSFEYGAGSKIYNEQKINGAGSSEGHEKNSENEIYLFGVSFSPYTHLNNKENIATTTNPGEIETMLKIIGTNFSSIMSNSMGVPDFKYNGMWKKARSESHISAVAAEMNRNNNTLSIKVLQGARLFKNSKKQPDVDNSFLSAENANNIFSGTVWGISLNVDNEWGYIQNSAEMSQVLSALNQQGYKRKAIENDLQIGTRMDICSEIVDGKNKNLLIELASVCNFIICSAYPPYGTEKPEDGVARISNMYQRYSKAFAKVNPNIDVIIATGWASEGDSDFNYKDFNTPKIQAKFWSEMRKWALDSKVRVFMHEAFDQPNAKEISYRHMGLWKKTTSGTEYIEKLPKNKTT